jgi:hypothetical protein
VVPRGLEPRTLRLLAVRSNQLSYETYVAWWKFARVRLPTWRSGLAAARAHHLAALEKTSALPPCAFAPPQSRRQLRRKAALSRLRRSSLRWRQARAPNFSEAADEFRHGDWEPRRSAEYLGQLGSCGCSASTFPPDCGHRAAADDWRRRRQSSGFCPRGERLRATLRGGARVGQSSDR